MSDILATEPTLGRECSLNFLLRYTFDDRMEFRNENAIKAAGKLRLEGKEYVPRDGDVCSFLIAN